MSRIYSYPGINRDLRKKPRRGDPMYPIGAHHNCRGADSKLLPVREVFMMILMDRLSDKVDWHKKVLDDEIVARWRKEALEQPEDELYLQVTEGKTSDEIPKPRGRIISEAAFDYCIRELRKKAAHFQNTGLVPTLDSAGNTIVKSDTVVTSELQKDLRTAFDQLRAGQASDVDWHPRSNEMVQDLVHPSMYPFIFGKSNFLQEEVVGVSDAIELWAGKGETVPEIVDPILITTRRLWDYSIGGSRVPYGYWSSKYQWLPANLAFQEDGTVKFTSYINNLHPKKYPEIYRTIERLIDVAIPTWDQCLSEYRGSKVTGVGRQKSRFSQPERCSNDDDHLWEPFNAEELARHDIELTQDELENLVDARSEDESSDGEGEIDIETSEDGQSDGEADDVQKLKWTYVRDPMLPEPDDATEVDYLCRKSLCEKFKATGLQVIVKMATIELTPEKPDFPMGGWHIEGQMNEQICATALFYLDSENVTPSHLSFRMQTSAYQDDLQAIAGQGAFNWLERVYGTPLGSENRGRNTCLQSYGSAETRQGRLLAFPNVLQHRVSPFKLQDPTKPGHRRFIAIWLVNPHRRIVSTANVPPQQRDWWADAVFGGGGGGSAEAQRGATPSEVFEPLAELGGPPSKSRKLDAGQTTAGRKLPQEIVDMVCQDSVAEGLMTAEEAGLHREELMKERSRFHEKAEASWQSVGYSFCEH